MLRITLELKLKSALGHIVYVHMSLLSSVQKLFFHLVSEPTSMNKCCTHLRAPFPQNANNHSSIGSSLSLEYKVGTGGGGGGGQGFPPDFGRSGEGQIMLITFLLTPGFSDLPTALLEYHTS